MGRKLSKSVHHVFNLSTIMSISRSVILFICLNDVHRLMIKTLIFLIMLDKNVVRRLISIYNVFGSDDVQQFQAPLSLRKYVFITVICYFQDWLVLVLDLCTNTYRVNISNVYSKNSSLILVPKHVNVDDLLK